jgi:hypothetical protein
MVDQNHGGKDAYEDGCPQKQAVEQLRAPHATRGLFDIASERFSRFRSCRLQRVRVPFRVTSLGSGGWDR